MRIGFHDQHGAARALGTRGRSRRELPLIDWQFDGNRRAGAWFALGANRAAHGLDDAVSAREAHTRPALTAARREERLECAFEDFGRHTLPRVTDDDPDPGRGAWGDFWVRRLDVEPSAGRHGVAR